MEIYPEMILDNYALGKHISLFFCIYNIILYIVTKSEPKNLGHRAGANPSHDTITYTFYTHYRQFRDAYSTEKGENHRSSKHMVNMQM